MSHPTEPKETPVSEQIPGEMTDTERLASLTAMADELHAAEKANSDAVHAFYMAGGDRQKTATAKRASKALNRVWARLLAAQDAWRDLAPLFRTLPDDEQAFCELPHQTIQEEEDCAREPVWIHRTFIEGAATGGPARHDDAAALETLGLEAWAWMRGRQLRTVLTDSENPTGVAAACASPEHTRHPDPDTPAPEGANQGDVDAWMYGCCDPYFIETYSEAMAAFIVAAYNRLSHVLLELARLRVEDAAGITDALAGDV